MLPEVAPRRRLGAIQAVAEVHLVEIQLEDASLGKLPLEVRGDQQLLDLSRKRLLGGQEALTGELLRNRAAALDGAAVPKVRHRRRDDAHEIEAVMLVEPLILDGDDRVLQVGRDPIERHADPLLLVNRERQSIVGIEDSGGLLHVADLLDGFRVREGARKRHQRPDARDQQEQRHRRRRHGRIPDEAWVLAPHPVPLRSQLIDTGHTG